MTSRTFRSLADMIWDASAAGGEQPALRCGVNQATWAQLRQRVSALAAALTARGVGPGVNCALLASLDITGVEALLAILHCGGCAVPLPVSATAEQIAALVKDAAPHLLLAGEAHRALAAPQTIAPMLGAGETGMIALDFTEAGWSALEAAHGGPPVAVRATDPCHVIYSSGTTGRPKGVVYAQSVRAYQASSAAANFANARVLASTPLYSNTTLAGGLLQGLAAGATVTLMSKFDALDFLHIVQSQRITHVTLVPVQFSRLLDQPSMRQFDLSSLRASKCTAAPAKPALKDRIAAHWPGAVDETYGFTEVGALSALNLKDAPEKYASVGRVRADVEIKFIGDDDKPAAANGPGEIVARTPTMMSGYYNQPALTEAAIWRDNDGRVFYRSGDVGFVDDDGFLSLVDRKKDMIISGGFNIYPADLEAVIQRHDAVLEAAVVGAPSEAWGETPVAFVVPGPGAAITAGELLIWVNAQLGKTQRLSALEFIDRLPRNSLGKVLKRELRGRQSEHSNERA